VVAALVLVLVGAPVAAEDTATTTTVESTTTTTTTTDPVVESSTPATSTTESTSTTGPTTSTPAAPSPTSTAVESASGATTPPPPSLVLNSGASASPAVPITGPAAASGVTPQRGTQVQLQAPPPPPPPEFQLPANSGSGRRAVYSKSLQRVWAVDENEVVIKTHRVSGRLDPLDPRPGTYSVYSRSFSTFAIQNPTITWNYMIRFAHGSHDGNIGFHAIPIQYGRPVQTIEQLGQPLSGGCVRQAPEDAIWMWNWAHVGTVVVVLA
jgi:lipoprotein-anchoring transpeptidase ErfK/SrfK